MIIFFCSLLDNSRARMEKTVRALKRFYLIKLKIHIRILVVRIISYAIVTSFKVQMCSG